MANLCRQQQYNVLRSSRKISFFFCPILTKSRLSPILNFMEICPAVSVLIHEDGQTDERTDMTKLIGAFCDYVNAHKSTRHTTVTLKMFIRVPTKQTKTNTKS